MDIAGRIAKSLIGQECSAVTRREFDWVFQFADSGALRTECPWRIVIGGKIALTESDHAQQFGLPAPIDGEVESKRLIAGKSIIGVTIRDGVGDISIAFDNGTVLEVWNSSSGYEGWGITVASGLSVIAMGGGELAIWEI